MTMQNVVLREEDIPHPLSLTVDVMSAAVQSILSRNVPFGSARGTKLLDPLAKVTQGAYLKATTPPVMVASVRSPGCMGQPLVPMTVNGTTVLCFVDTGSKATIMKPLSSS